MRVFNEEAWFDHVGSGVTEELQAKIDEAEVELKKSLASDQTSLLIKLSDLRCQEMGAALAKAAQLYQDEISRCRCSCV